NVALSLQRTCERSGAFRFGRICDPPRVSERSGRCRNERTRLSSRFGLGGSTVPYRRVVAVVQQPQSDGGSHPASSGDADRHLMLQRNVLFSRTLDICNRPTRASPNRFVAVKGGM